MFNRRLKMQIEELGYRMSGMSGILLRLEREHFKLRDELHAPKGAEDFLETLQLINAAAARLLNTDRVYGIHFAGANINCVTVGYLNSDFEHKTLSFAWDLVWDVQQKD